jgi:hypothetical protein
MRNIYSRSYILESANRQLHICEYNFLLAVGSGVVRSALDRWSVSLSDPCDARPRVEALYE